MAVLDQFKNLIRHGKAAKEGTRSFGDSPDTGRTTAHRQDGGNIDRNRNVAEGLYLESKAAPASTQMSTDAAATAKGYSAGPSGATASAIPAHIASGNMNVGTNQQSHAASQQNYKESERIVEEERAASEKLPNYPELSDRFQLLMKMGE